MADVFLSYARANAAAAARAARELEKIGVSVWYDPELPAHRAYSDVIAAELESAKSVLVLWSSAAAESQWVRSEANRARELGKLVQARLDDVRLPMPFDQIQCADLTKWRGGRGSAHWAKITNSVEALAGGEQPRPRAAPDRTGLGRRELIAGGAAAAVAASGAGWVIIRGRKSEPRLSPETTALMEQAKASVWQNTPEGQNQAIGLLRQIVADNPNYAEAWGRLAMAYGVASHWRGMQEAELLQERSRAAARRSLSLDPDAPFGLIGSAISRPYLRNWGMIEPPLRRAVALSPKDGEVNFMLAFLLAMVGRSREALDHVTNLPSRANPGIYVWHAQMLWSAGRAEELDALLDEATKLYPTHFGVWFTRFYTDMMGGRPEAALAFAADTANRPLAINPEEVDSVVRVAKAIQTRSPPEVEAVVKEWTERSRHGAGYAENASQFIASLGQTEAAMRVLRAYYFSEGFDCGEVRFESSIGSFTPRNDRQTAFLFNPAMANVRADPRFSDLTSELKLTDYWRASGRKPDYLAG